jgi:hypothetical protein
MWPDARRHFHNTYLYSIMDIGGIEDPSLFLDPNEPLLLPETLPTDPQTSTAQTVPASHPPPTQTPVSHVPVPRTTAPSSTTVTTSSATDRRQRDSPSIEKITRCPNYNIDESLQQKKNNWDLWCQSISLILGLADVMEYVDWTIPRPDPT